jgi:DNA-binding transcriptional MerR regulator
MNDSEKRISVSQLAKLSGCSVRTLHYYDELGLLEPSGRTASGYRYYERAELLKLQQILFYRELELPLEQIRTLIWDPDFDAIKALLDQRNMLLAKQNRLSRLIETIDKTIAGMRSEGASGADLGGVAMLSEKEIFEGFAEEDREAIKEESSKKWPDKYAQSMDRLKSMSKADFAALKQEGNELWQEAAGLMDHEPSSNTVQDLMERLFIHMNKYYDCTKEIFAGLGQSYVDDPRFAKFYDRIKPGLNEFLRDAMRIYAE